MSESHVDENVKVVIRMRHLNEAESAADTGQAWKVYDEYNTVKQLKNEDDESVDTRKGRTLFTFDKVFDGNSTTDEVYNSLGKDLIQGVLLGINASVFAYGQTSSGKTFTMQGSRSFSKGSAEGSKCEGVIQLASKEIFSLISESLDSDYKIFCSVIEVYNEEVRDLLVKKGEDRELTIRENQKYGIFVNASKRRVADYEDLIRLLSIGEKKRTVASTNLNAKSSRSHTIYSIYIESKPKGIDDKNHNVPTVGATLNLVDLAGSEGEKMKVQSSTGSASSSERRMEGSSINKSLLTLSRVIVALGNKKRAHVSFRDSKLTRVLQPALSGAGRMAFICCITPSALFLEETRSTLQFGASIKRIRTNANVKLLSGSSSKKSDSHELAEAKKTLSLMKRREQSLMKENKELKSMVEKLTSERDVAISRVKKSENQRKQGDISDSSESETTYYVYSVKQPADKMPTGLNEYFSDSKAERSDGFPAAVAVSVDSSDSFSDATDPTRYGEAVAN